jgi:hypothetical protein
VNLLKAALYDPAVAVSKATSALLAMTAFDTANLRLAITVPAHGMVRFRLRCAIVGATTCPVILLGVLNGAAVIGRVQPQSQPVTAPAATQVFVADAEFTATGLAPGAMNVDAAYAVQVLVAATNIKYGGPNTNAGANAWGAFVFEAWDPQPQQTNGQLLVDANGRVDVSKVAGTAQTAGDIPAKTNSLTFTGANKVDASVRDWVGDAIPARNVAGVPIVDLKYTLGTLSPAAAGSVRADQVTGAVGSVTGNVGGNVAGSVASVTARVSANVDQVDGAALTAHAAGKMPADVLTVAGTAQTARDIGAQLDATVSSRLAAAAYTAPDNVTIGQIAGYIDTEVAAIKAKTDQLNFSVAGRLDVNVLYFNSVQVMGTGAVGDRWRSA